MQPIHVLKLIQKREENKTENTTNFIDRKRANTQKNKKKPKENKKNTHNPNSKLTKRHILIQKRKMEEISIDDEYDDGSDEGVNGFDFVNNSSSSQPNPRKTIQNRPKNSINSIHSQCP